MELYHPPSCGLNLTTLFLDDSLARRRLGCTSSFLFVLALFLIFVLPQVAPWPLSFLGMGFLIVSITTWSMKSTISVYNEQNEKVALRWKAFAEHMRLLTLGQGVLGAEAFASYLSYATSFGLLTDWTSMMQNHGILALPPWFRALETAGYIRDQRQAFREFHRMYQNANQAGQSSSGSRSGGGFGSSMSGSSGAAGGDSSSAG